MFKKFFQIIALYIFNISLFAQENDNIPQKDIDKPEENILPQEKDKKEDLIEKEGENKDKTENDKNSEDSIQQDEDLNDEGIKESDFDDNVDMSLFNKNKARNFFVVSPLGIGFNGFLYSKGNWWHNGFNSFNLFHNCCENIKKYKHKMILNNYNISFDIFQYNIIIGKGFTFFVGLNFMWKHFLFLQEDETCIKYLSIYSNTQELNTLNQVKNESPVIINNHNANPNANLNANPKDKNQERKEKLQKESEEYYAKTDKDCDKEVYSISLFNIGLLTGFAWYSNLLNVKKSWFLKILLYARYQSVKNFIVNIGDNNQERIESKYLRIRPFDLTCGLEIGYGKVSLTFFMSILPLLNENKKYDNGKIEGLKKVYVGVDNLFNCGVILKINIF